MSGSSDPLTPSDAREAMRSLTRDVTQLVRNGMPVPSWAKRVLQFLATIADEPAAGSDSGTAHGTVEATDRLHMVPTAEAAADLGVSDTYVRRLAREGRIRATRINERAWVVDLDSLRAVIRRAA